MGGEGHDGNYLSDILIFKTNTQTITTKSEDGGFKFSGDENQCALTAPNQVNALVKDENFKPALISYKLGKRYIKILRKW